jgi:hypothetical protein
MTSDPNSGVIITAVTHDLVQKRSFVTLQWASEAGKRLALPIPFGCALDDIPAEAEKALRALSREIGTMAISMPSHTAGLPPKISN